MRFRYSFCALLILLIAVSALTAQDRGRARSNLGGERGGSRQFNVARYLQGLDQDKNGYVTGNELRGGSQRFIENMGFDVSRPVSIKAILNKMDADREKKASAEQRKKIDSERKVSKFGELVELPPVMNFGSGDRAPRKSFEEYDEAIREATKRSFERYDTNRNGIIDANEAPRVRQINEETTWADVNKDGKYNQAELASILNKRQEEMLNRSRMENSDRRESGNRRTGSAEDWRNRRSRPTATTSTVRTATVAPTRPTRTLESRLGSYADSIMKKYDRNKDGFLDKTERQSVKNIKDLDGDGKISRQEVITNAAGISAAADSSKTSSDSRQTATKTTSRGTSSDSAGDSLRRDITNFGSAQTPAQNRQQAGSKQGSPSLPGDLVKLDKNADGQIQMHEFAQRDEWTDEKIAEFYQRDKNGDGVITPDEG